MTSSGRSEGIDTMSTFTRTSSAIFAVVGAATVVVLTFVLLLLLWRVVCVARVEHIVAVSPDGRYRAIIVDESAGAAVGAGYSELFIESTAGKNRRSQRVLRVRTFDSDSRSFAWDSASRLKVVIRGRAIVSRFDSRVPLPGDGGQLSVELVCSSAPDAQSD